MAPTRTFAHGKATLILPAAIFFCVLAYQVLIALRYFEQSGSALYLELAKNLVDGLGYTLDGHHTAFRPPAYPLFLASILYITPEEYAKYGVIIGQSILAVLCFMATAVLAKKVTGSHKIASLSALLFSLNTSMISEFIAKRETGLYALFVVVYALVFARERDSLRKAALLGVISGITLLIRPSGILFIPISALLIAGFWNNTSIVIKLKAMLIFFMFYTFTVLPWQLYLYDTFDRTEMTGSSTSGMNLAKGNLPLFGDIYIAVDVDKGDPYILKLLEDNNISFYDEFTASDFLRARTIEAMKSSPVRVMQRFIQKFLLYFSPSDVYYGDGNVELGPNGELRVNSFKPRNSLTQILNHSFKVFLIPFGLLGMFSALYASVSMRKWAAFAALLILGSATLHGMTFPEFRFRYAIEPLICLGAAYMLHNYLEKTRQRTSPA